MPLPLFLGDQRVQGVDWDHFPYPRAFHKDLLSCLIEVWMKNVGSVKNCLGGPQRGVVSKLTTKYSGANGCRLRQEETFAMDVSEDCFRDRFLSQMFG